MTKVESEKIDRLENHFNEVKDSVRNIESALVGSNVNGNKGIINLLDSIDVRVQSLEDKQILNDEFINNLKWFQRGLIGVIFAYITWVLTK